MLRYCRVLHELETQVLLGCIIIHTSLNGGEDERDGERGSTLGDGGDAAVVADSREEPRQSG